MDIIKVKLMVFNMQHAITTETRFIEKLEIGLRISYIYMYIYIHVNIYMIYRYMQ